MHIHYNWLCSYTGFFQATPTELTLPATPTEHQAPCLTTPTSPTPTEYFSTCSHSRSHSLSMPLDAPEHCLEQLEPQRPSCLLLAMPRRSVYGLLLRPPISVARSSFERLATGYSVHLITHVYLSYADCPKYHLPFIIDWSPTRFPAVIRSHAPW